MKTIWISTIILFTLSLFICLPHTDAIDTTPWTQWDLPEGAKARLGKGRVRQIAHAPDGARLAVATSSGIWLYDAQTGEELNLFPPANLTGSAVFSPDSQMLATRNIKADGVICLWDVSTGNLIRTLGSGDVFAYSPDGGILVSEYNDFISLWDVETGKLIRTFTEQARWIKRVAFSPEGETLASAGSDGIHLWDIETGSLLYKLTEEETSVIDVAFSPDGQTLASAGSSSDPTVRLWDVSTGNLIHTLDEQRYPDRVVFSTDGQTLISGGYPNAIHLWDVRTGNLSRKFTGHTEAGHRNRIISLMLSADGQTLTGGDWDGAIHSWDFGTGNLLRTLKLGMNIDSVEFRADGQTLTSVGRNGIHLWNPGASSSRRTITEHEIGCVFNSVFSPDRATIAGYAGGTIRLLEAGTGRLIRWFRPLLFHGINLAFSPDGQMIAGTGDPRVTRDTTIHLWDVETGSLIRIITVEEIDKQINSIAFSPDSETLASAGYSSGDGSIRLWDVETGSLIRTFTEQETWVLSVAFSPEGQTLASAGKDGIRLWDVETGSLIRTFTDSWTQSVAFSPEGQTLASVGSDGIHLWDAGTGNLLRTLSETRGEVIAFSPEGQTLATTDNGTVFLWNVTPAFSEPEKLSADVNGDGEVNIEDLIAVAAALGEVGENDADVNGDGEVNIEDLIAVAAALGEVAAAPAALRQQGAAHLTQEEVQHWLTQAQQAHLTDAVSLRGIRFLKQLLAALIPKETALLPNYPNPFNPETWIPYQLATPADVTLTIYDIQGRVVRDLDLGHQRAGMYHTRSRAAYWDGKNAQGESVASGVYFYTLTAGDFSATRKMLIAK